MTFGDDVVPVEFDSTGSYIEETLDNASKTPLEGLCRLH
jgi:hypothetical protein